MLIAVLLGDIQAAIGGVQNAVMRDDGIDDLLRAVCI
jgi:hypothetical protein